jgi:hypothetical protein
VRRRALLAAPLLLAACGDRITVSETIETAPLPRPLTPALIVPGVMLPAALADRDAREVEARAALARAIGDRPIAEPAADGALAAEARARGLGRVVLLTVVQAAPEGALIAPGTTVAIRVRAIDARTGVTEGFVTLSRRNGAQGGVGPEIEALARDILR